jgi:hypothetical protein
MFTLLVQQAFRKLPLLFSFERAEEAAVSVGTKSRTAGDRWTWRATMERVRRN